MEHRSLASHLSYGIEQRCVYHPQQTITNFCKREECCLPVCPICIPIHTQQHKQIKTSPKFEEQDLNRCRVNKIYEDILAAFEKLEKFIKEISQYLSQIVSDRKKNESEVRQRMLTTREKLIKEFQKSIIEMEDKIIEQIVKVDKEFVVNLTAIDEELSKIKSKTKKIKSNLEGEESIKHMIIYFGKRDDKKYRGQLDEIKKRAEQLTKMSMNVIVREEELVNIKKKVANYIRLQIVKQKASKQ